MNLSEIFIRRPVMTALVMISILFFGVLALRTLPVSDLPNFDAPTIQVKASYPGANPETMANNVVVPLEKKFLTIDGIKSIASTSSTGSASLVLQFYLDKSIDTAASDVQAAISQAGPQLPQDLPYSPTYAKVNPSAAPVLFLSVTSSTMQIADLYDYADTVIGQRLNTVDGVAQVVIYGSPFAVRVQIDPNKLAAKQIGIDEVGEAIKSQNVNLPIGTLYGDKTKYNLNASGQLFHASGYDNIIIKNENGNIVRLSDVGRALDSTYDDKYYLQYSGDGISSAAVVVAIQTQAGANALTVINGIHELLPKLEKSLPGSVSIHPLFDKGEYIQEAVNDVELTLIIAIALVVLVIFIYLGKAIDTIIPAVALPICIFGTFSAMFLLGYSIDILSLLAITLSIGFLIDDAIVVLENIARHVEAGEPPLQAALKGSKEISLTVVSMTLCLASVFIPMLFMTGVMGRIFSEFAYVIFLAVIISGFISLSLTPMLCSRFIAPHSEEKKRGGIERFSIALNRRLLSTYETSLNWILVRKPLMLGIGIGSVVLTLLIFQALPKSFLPSEDIGFIQGFTQAPDNTSPFQMNRYQETITSIIQKKPYTDSIISIGALPNDNQGLFFLRLKPLGQRPAMDQIIKDLYRELYSYPGAQTFVRGYPLINLEIGTQTSQGDYQYMLQSIRQDELFTSAGNLIQKMKTLPGFTQVSSDLHISQPQMNVEILRDRASVLDVDSRAIENALSLAFGGLNLSPINDPNNQYYVVMELEPKY
jgi:HAE1 family hydrophobic/amphiphilic exporter-1